MRNGRLLATVDDRGTLYLWDTEGQQRLKWVSGQPEIIALAAAPDGRTLALAGRDSTILLVDVTKLGK
jgi:WD40 repeat protein